MINAADYCAGTTTLHNLSLRQALTIAECALPARKAQLANIAAQEARVSQAQSDYYPTLSAYGNAGRTQVETDSSEATTNKQAVGISLSYLLWDFGARSGKKDSVKAKLSALRLSSLRDWQALQQSVINAYLSLQSAMSSLSSNEVSLASARSTMELATAKEKAGIGTAGDRLSATAAFAEALIGVMDAEGQVDSAKSNLASALGINMGSAISVPAPTLPTPTAMPSSIVRPDIPALINIALANRPDLASARADIQADEASINAINSGQYPTLSINGSYNKSLSDDDSRARTTAASINLSVPLFAGGDTYYQEVAAKSALTAKVESIKTLEQKIAQEVTQYATQHFTAKRRIESTTLLVESAKEADRLARARYREGVGSFTALLQAQDSLAKASGKNILAAIDKLRTHIALQIALGLPFDEALSQY